jgi:hypothetical protein
MSNGDAVLPQALSSTRRCLEWGARPAGWEFFRHAANDPAARR